MQGLGSKHWLAARVGHVSPGARFRGSLGAGEPCREEGGLETEAAPSPPGPESPTRFSDSAVPSLFLPQGKRAANETYGGSSSHHTTAACASQACCQ